MAVREFELEHGFVVGRGADAEKHFDVVLRELGSGDLIDASMAAEKVAFTPDGKAVSYTSDVLYGFELLRRQVQSIGDIQGPLSLKDLRKFHPDDLEKLQSEASELDRLVLAVADRGRDEPAGGNR